MVCKILTIFPDIRRNLSQYQASDGRDFDNTEPMSIQAKWHKKITMGLIKKALNEAMSAVDDRYEYAAAVTKENGHEPMIHMRLKDFNEMQCRWEDGEL
jgi:hypothetical protein